MGVATILGLVTLSGFALVYGRAAGRWSWPADLALGWVAAAGLGVVAGGVEAGLLVALAVATLSIALAFLVATTAAILAQAALARLRRSAAR